MFAWLSDLTKPDVMKLSQRFLASYAIGKILAGYLLNTFAQLRRISNNLNNECSCAEVQSIEIHNFALNLLCAGYMFFIFLSYTAKRVNRKRQIIQLIEEVNGIHIKPSKKIFCIVLGRHSLNIQQRRIKPRIKGQYTVLLDDNYCIDTTENEFSSSDELDY